MEGVQHGCDSDKETNRPSDHSREWDLWRQNCIPYIGTSFPHSEKLSSQHHTSPPSKWQPLNRQPASHLSWGCPTEDRINDKYYKAGTVKDSNGMSENVKLLVSMYLSDGA